MSVDRQDSGLELAERVSEAFASGDRAAAAARAGEAAAAFLAEQGEPTFDAPNMLRVRADALLALGDHAAAAPTLDRADALALPLPEGEPFDRLKVHLGRLRGLALLDARALEIYRVAGAAPGVVATLHHNLGGLAHSRDDLVTAERETRRALELHTSSSGAGHPDTAADRGQLAAILSELGRHDEAEREL